MRLLFCSVPAHDHHLELLPEDMDEFAQTFMAELFCGEASIAMGNDIVEVIEAWKPDIVLRDTGELGGCLAAERAGLPPIDDTAVKFLEKIHAENPCP